MPCAAGLVAHCPPAKGKPQMVRHVLARFLKLESGKRRRKKRFVGRVDCAYCRGTGVDLKYGNMSKCPVCGGAGIVKVEPPVAACLKCRGTGRENGNLTCLACKGMGAVSVPKGADTCPKCKGTGKDGVFYCAPCRGQGIV